MAGTDEPTLLTTQHVDLRVTYDASRETPLGLMAYDDDAQPPRAYASTNCVLVVGESSRVELPGDLPPLGVAGDSLWALPASQTEGLLYLGLSAEGLPSGVLAGQIQVRLVDLEGPGHFFLWQAELGALQFFMNSRDGLGETDTFPQLLGGHSHANWGFSTSGVYRVTLQAEARRLGETTNQVSVPTTFTFHVLPLPPEVASPFERWQAEQWPGLTDPAIIGAEADPDADGRPNVREYAEGTNPRESDGSSPNGGLRLGLETAGTEARWMLQVRRRTIASDVEIVIQTTDDLAGPWTRLDPWVAKELEEGDWTRIEGVDPRGVASMGGRYYRLGLRITNDR